ncbi:MAG: hypothetical protein M1825_003486 [Sarcosagium campestre]|nr:MAG: hypothetical protein M1825_003486 [Sarcosagium campestre]
MLYELIAVVRPGKLSEVKEIAKSVGGLVLRSGGVVRGLTNWGPFMLPRRTRVHQATYSEGHYFIMRFDASGRTQSTMRRNLGLDPRMIRFSVVKMADNLEKSATIEGKCVWRKTTWDK